MRKEKFIKKHNKIFEDQVSEILNNIEICSAMKCKLLCCVKILAGKYQIIMKLIKQKKEKN
jgi:hypothetical protein